MLSDMIRKAIIGPWSDIQPLAILIGCQMMIGSTMEGWMDGWIRLSTVVKFKQIRGRDEDRGWLFIVTCRIPRSRWQKLIALPFASGCYRYFVIMVNLFDWIILCRLRNFLEQRKKNGKKEQVILSITREWWHTGLGFGCMCFSPLLSGFLTKSNMRCAVGPT